MLLWRSWCNSSCSRAETVAMLLLQRRLFAGRMSGAKNIQGTRLTFRLAFEPMEQYRFIPQDSCLLPKRARPGDCISSHVEGLHKAANWPVSTAKPLYLSKFIDLAV